MKRLLSSCSFGSGGQKKRGACRSGSWQKCHTNPRSMPDRPEGHKNTQITVKHRPICSNVVALLGIKGSLRA